MVLPQTFQEWYLSPTGSLRFAVSRLAYGSPLLIKTEAGSPVQKAGKHLPENSEHVCISGSTLAWRFRRWRRVSSLQGDGGTN